MAFERSGLEELRAEILGGRLNRRDVLRRSLALGLSAPVIASLLAACGDDDDDDDDDDTGQAEDPTPTEAADQEPEPTEEPDEEPTDEEEPTQEEEEPTEEPEEEPTQEEPADGEQTFDGGDRLMGKDIEPAGSEGGVFISGGISDLSTLSPIMSNDTTSSDFQDYIFESLFEPNPDTLEPVGNLAASWSVNADGDVWTINLREGVTWHDGEAFTADDVKFTYDLHMTEETNSPRFSDFTSKIESVEILDEMTVRFTLTGPLPDFPLDLGVYGIVAEHVWADVAPADHAQDDGATGADPSRVVGTGPFIFEEWLIEDRASAVRNDNYWDGVPHLDRVIYRFVGDQNAVLQALITGDIDYGAVPEASVQQLDGTDVTVFNYPTTNFTFYGTNLDAEKTTLFQDVNVRKALLYALDREAMLESIRFGFGEVAIGTMPVLSWAYNPDGIEDELHYNYDPDLARQLLDEAGWTLNDDGIREKDGQTLSFEMQTNAGNTVREQYLTIMQEFWREIGVEMTPVFEPFPALVERITETFDFQAFLIGFSWGVPPGQEAMWDCDSYPQGFNIVKYCNPDVDAVMEEAAQEVDRDRRIELYTEMQNLILADLPMAVLDFPEGIAGLNQRVHNAFPNDPNFRFNTETWWIE